MKKNRRRREAKKKRRAAREAKLEAFRGGEGHMPYFARAAMAGSGRPPLRLVEGGKKDDGDA